jgi:hypothetical protein
MIQQPYTSTTFARVASSVSPVTSSPFVTLELPDGSGGVRPEYAVDCTDVVAHVGEPPLNARDAVVGKVLTDRVQVGDVQIPGMPANNQLRLGCLNRNRLNQEAGVVGIAGERLTANVQFVRFIFEAMPARVLDGWPASLPAKPGQRLASERKAEAELHATGTHVQPGNLSEVGASHGEVR